MKHRLFWFRILILLSFLVVFWRLFHWMVLDSSRLRSIAQSQYEKTTTVSVSRGLIYTADGFPLVVNQPIFTLFAKPKNLKLLPVQIARLISPELVDIAASDSATLKTELEQSLIEKLSQPDKNWVSLKRNLTEDVKTRLERLSLEGIGFEPLEARYYPEASMAAQLIGFVGKNDIGVDTGYFGLEGEYNLELGGKAGVFRRETDALGNTIAIGNANSIEKIEPRDLHLSVSRGIQFLLESKLKEGLEKYGAKSGDVLIMDPKTGSILGMAALPSYDPGSFASYDASLYRNPLVADGYEPGSTFKVLTVAAGIDAGAIGPDTQCSDCGAPKRIGKYVIKTWNNEYFPNITMRDALSKSDNTAMMYIVDHLGKEKYVDYLHRFGIGEKTEIDLQEEASPTLREHWGDVDAATASFGQGIALTPIQLVRAVGAIANGGELVRPHVVKEVVARSRTYPIETQVVRRVISESTAKTVTEMMIESAAHGDAKWAIPKGYLIAGKTGTAQIPVDGHYDEKRTIASFVGFAPADDPKFVMLVRLFEPSTSQWGSETAAPLWFSIARDLFVKLGINPKL